MSCSEFRGSALAGQPRTAVRNRLCGQGPRWRSGPCASFSAGSAPWLRPVCEMAMDLRLGQFISDRALQPQRPGAAGGGVPGVLEPDHWNLAVDLLEAPEYRRGGRAG